MNHIKIFMLVFFLAYAVVSAASAGSIDSVKADFHENETRPYALVAGGSKGIGFAIAEALARRGFNLILIARNKGPLMKARDTLQRKYGVHVEILVKDLALEKSANEIATWCNERGIPLKMLCNVAGMGGTRDYLSLSPDSLRYMVNVNVESAMVLTLELLPLLERNAPSYVLNVASMAAFAPIPDKNMYSATKSAVMYFSYALRYQLKEKRISVSCLSPGPVFTKPSVVRDTKKNLGWIGTQMAVSPGRVGEVAVHGTLTEKMLIVPGTLAKISSTLIRVLPRRVITSFYYRVGKKNMVRGRKKNEQ